MNRWFVILLLSLPGCSPRVQTLSTPYDERQAPTRPDYSKDAHWAALPQKRDAADSVPFGSGFHDDQSKARVDVFFVYPTIYTGKPNPAHPWNADVTDATLNGEIQRSTILHQASVFNGSCRVYAPYYRQAHLYAFYTGNPEDGQRALDLAYTDVRAAFQYYLEHHNQGRPIVMASHSQGSYHTMRLLQEFFDDKPLRSQLVAAYPIGRALPRDALKTILPTEGSDETGVWASWNTFARGYVPDRYEKYYVNALSVNPLLWNTSSDYAPKTLNRGGVGPKFNYLPEVSDAQNHDNLLWINKPYVKGRAFLRTRIWHRADINLFYGNIRENVAARVKKFLDH